jgi:hypothetical protein
VSKVTNVTASSPFSNEWQNRCSKAVRILAGFEIVLILATWPLWWGHGSFPAIPLFGNFSFPLIADRVLLGILLAGCVHIVCVKGFRKSETTVRFVTLVAALLLSADNQQRLQAWHWLFVVGLATSFFEPKDCLQLLRSVLASVYVCSALSRIGPTAYQGMSAAIVDQLLRMSGFRIAMNDGRMAEVLCQALNIGELAVGLLLIWPKSRSCGIMSAMILHTTLLVALGPYGLRHHNGVLIWNLCFLCLIPVVFFGPVAGLHLANNRPRRAYQTATLFVWLFPLSGLIGIADNWPAWQLYSTRPESWTLQIRETDIQYLNERILPFVSEPAPLDDWIFLRLDRWSLAATGSPLYPEDRFQCEVIRQILATLPDDAVFRVEISEPERWFWWNRGHRTLTNRTELNATCP